VRSIECTYVCVAIFAMGCSARDRMGAPIGTDAGTAVPDAGSMSRADAGPPPDAEAPEECRDVDVLFVIDNSASMADNQDSLIRSFPGFIGAIREHLAFATSVHIGVVTTDAYRDNDASCREIGDLVTNTGGISSSMSSCGPFASGGRYLDASEPDLDAKFACIAKVGAGGDDDERAARALLDAVDPARNAPGSCNAGFIRPDSLLVVVIITDEDDVMDGCDGSDPFGGCMSYGSGGLPDDWVAELVADRGGIADNIVVLSLLGRRADNPCGAVVAARLLGFARRFDDQGFVGDVCAESYDSFFAEALPIIDRACASYVPLI
jgi:hypothetical protein